MKLKSNFPVLLVCCFVAGCQLNQERPEATHPALQVMEQHLQAVSQKNLQSLADTLDPDGRMQLILPQSEIREGTEAFLAFHRDWFANGDWTFETRILNHELGRDLAMVVVEIIYREPERDGKPYVNRMIVSYDLIRKNGRWYVIKDHASSVRKSTDP
jgi:ketosteroid isomerase-like protein